MRLGIGLRVPRQWSPPLFPTTTHSSRLLHAYVAVMFFATLLSSHVRGASAVGGCVRVASVVLLLLIFLAHRRPSCEPVPETRGRQDYLGGMGPLDYPLALDPLADPLVTLRLERVH